MLVFLYWLASATSYRVVEEAFAIPTPTVFDLVHKASKRVLAIVKRVIRFPTAAEMDGVGAGFARLAGSAVFARAAGSIDGCHVRVVAPAAHEQAYLNRRLFHSIQFQAICDHRGKFLDVFVGYPGSVHDAHVLRHSDVYVHQLYPPQAWFLIGDVGYPCIQDHITLITPYREPVQSPVHHRFNSKRSRARLVVEQAFGVMKTRWRTIFLKAMAVRIPFAVEVITCCAVLFCTTCAWVQRTWNPLLIRTWMRLTLMLLLILRWLMAFEIGLQLQSQHL
ncbi:putative nuclease HARBI1 [Labrus bergylta]|uniref:putative nuclease HARBI1 n=1 Tax=Labrus bergylta TaxID=56723 RepID=UPI0009B445AB|nr:putative nuclease HARBI1 [Labrus bergylta]